jgi:protein-L-isoaspartate(D-aspartate) O-methyltransferase
VSQAVRTARGSARERRAERVAMVRRQIAARGVRAPRVLAALARVRRHEFVPAALAGEAYSDAPLLIGSHQTISQPYIVALMTEALRLRRRDRVLEIGTGSGYQTAVLAELAARVYSIERVTALADEARERLARLGYTNVELRLGDGSLGWPEAAPFDAIIVTAAAPSLPAALEAQLVDGGRLVAPVGGLAEQILLVATKTAGRLVVQQEGPVRFVPLVGAQGFSR